MVARPVDTSPYSLEQTRRCEDGKTPHHRLPDIFPPRIGELKLGLHVGAELVYRELRHPQPLHLPHTRQDALFPVQANLRPKIGILDAVSGFDVRIFGIFPKVVHPPVQVLNDTFHLLNGRARLAPVKRDDPGAHAILERVQSVASLHAEILADVEAVDRGKDALGRGTHPHSLTSI